MRDSFELSDGAHVHAKSAFNKRTSSFRSAKAACRRRAKRVLAPFNQRLFVWDLALCILDTVSAVLSLDIRSLVRK